MTRRRIGFAIPCLLLPAVLAQEPQTALVPAVPARPLFVLQIDGPAALWRRFLPTDVGSMLASKDADAFWRLLQEPMKLAVASAGGADADAERTLAAWRGYAGRITLAVDVPPEPPALDDATGFVVLADDGETDLSPLGELLEGTARKLGAKLEAISIGERAIVVARTAHDWSFTMPLQVDGHEVVAFGADVEPALRRALAGPGFRPDAELARSPIGARLDLERVVASFEHELGEFMVDPKPEDFLRTLGFDSLRELRLLARPSGPHVELETSLSFSDHERGVFGGLFPAGGEPPRLQSLVPEGLRNWQAIRHRWDRAAGAICAAGKQFSTRDMFREFWGVDMERDLLAHLGDEILMLGDVVGTGDDRAESGTGALVFEVRDAKAFDTSLDSMLDHLDYEPDDEAIDGLTIWRTRGWLEPETVARIGDFVVLAWGDRSTEWIGGIARRARLEQPEPPDAAAFERLARHAPPGENGQGRVAVGAVSSLFLDAFGGALPDDLDSALEDSIAELRRLLRARGVDRAWVLTGHDGDRWRARVFW